MLYSGIDLHKRSLVIHTLDADGTTAREAELKSDRAAVLAYFGTLAGPHRAVVECVQSWYWLRDLLAPAGVDLRLAHAKYVKAISYAKVKTDRVDARMLAQPLRVGLIPEAHMIGAENRETRDLLRSRLQLVTRAVRCQHAVGSLLEKYNVATPPEPAALARMQATLQDEQRTLVQTHIKRVEATRKQRLLPTPDGQRLVWVPGIGTLGAYALVLEIDDVQRFPTVRHFHSYCRLVPGADNSAGKTRHKRSRDGTVTSSRSSHGGDPGGAVPPGDPARVPAPRAAEGEDGGAGADRQGTREHRVFRPAETGGVQWSGSRIRANAEAPAVAAAGEPGAPN